MRRSAFNNSRLALAVFLFLILVLSGCAAPHQVRIKPEVKASRAGIEITNRDAFKYPQVTVFVKGHFSAEAGDIAAGETIHLPFEKFVNDDGKHFDMATMTPEAIRIRAWFDGKAASKIYQVN